MSELNSEASVCRFRNNINKDVNRFQKDLAKAIHETVRTSANLRNNHPKDRTVAWYDGICSARSVFENDAPSSVIATKFHANKALLVAAKELFEAYD